MGVSRAALNAAMPLLSPVPPKLRHPSPGSAASRAFAGATWSGPIA
jgi:hypothetical protein